MRSTKLTTTVLVFWMVARWLFKLWSLNMARDPAKKISQLKSTQKHNEINKTDQPNRPDQVPISL